MNNLLNPFVLMSMRRFRKNVENMNQEQRLLLIKYFEILLKTIEPNSPNKVRTPKLKLKDMIHEIEVCPLDALQCYKLVKELKNQIKIYRERVKK